MSKLKYLDVSNCTLITQIYLTGTPNLETLIVNGIKNIQAVNSSSENLPGLKSLKLKHMEFTDVDLATANLITNLEGSKATLEYLDLSRATMNKPSISGFSALKTFKAAGNYNLTSGSSKISMSELTINESPLLSSIDLTGNAALTSLNLTRTGRNNSNIDGLFTGLTDCTALEMINFDGNAFTSVPAFGHDTYTSLKLNKNALTGIDMSTADKGVRFLYAEENGLGGDVTLTAASTGALEGLDLNNNGITSFKAESTALSALMIGNNAGMTTLELHGNDNLTGTTATATMSSGSGLYLLGNTALKTIDLSNSSFTGIGQNGSLSGLSNVETLNGSHNKFTTFTNASALAASSYKHEGATITVAAVDAHADMPNLEALVGLKNLDLSYNALQDSIHLYKNTHLKRLDVSHNQVITHNANKGKNANGKFYTTSELANLIQTQKKREYKLYTWIAKVGNNVEPYTGDQNDTIAIYNLDLKHNNELEYLNISYTGIQYTALQHYYTYNPRYVWIQNCKSLKEFYADYNGMRAFGISNTPAMERISARAMRGADMVTMQGSINLHGENCPNLHYADFRDSQFDSIGTCFTPALDTLLVSGNPIQYLNFCRTGKVGNNTLAPNSKLVYVDATDCTIDKRQSAIYPNGTPITNVGVNDSNREPSGLRAVRAFDLCSLDHLDLSGNTALNLLYCNDDPALPQITGLDDCTALQYLHAYNDELLGQNGFNVNSNAALKTLWVDNCSLSGELAVSHCTQMDSLRCADNRITTLNVAPLTTMHWLDCYNNLITELKPASSTAMTHLDLHNNQVLDLDIAANTAMIYFDCDNNHVRELNLAGAQNIATIHANDNNLFSINLTGAHDKLADLQFKNNHINGIDLSGCDNKVLTKIEDMNNGRTVQANFNIVKGKNMYYFQLKDIKNGGKYLCTMNCTEDNETYGRELEKGITDGAKSLINDGFVLDKVTWNEPSISGNRKSRADDYDINPDKVIGEIVILENTSTDASQASGSEEYTYDNGIGTSTFYLNWTATGNVVTALDDLASDDTDIVIETGAGSISVTTAHDTIITIVDMNGHVIAQREVAAGTTGIPTPAPGIYIVNGHKVTVR